MAEALDVQVCTYEVGVAGLPDPSLFLSQKQYTVYIFHIALRQLLANRLEQAAAVSGR